MYFGIFPALQFGRAAPAGARIVPLDDERDLPPPIDAPAADAPAADAPATDALDTDAPVGSKRYGQLPPLTK